MIELKKKCWREKVTAEITTAHVQQFIHEMGTDMTAAEVAQFLNDNGRAQIMWTYMMQAAEQYIKSSVKTECPRMSAIDRPTVQATMVQ